MRQKRYLFLPIGLLLLLFSVDAIFRIPYIQLLAKLDLTPINYKAKADLLEKLVQNSSPGSSQKSSKKLLLVLGSSRFLYFDSKQLQEFYPDWDIYNFSSAVTTPAYYDYQITKILDAGIRPDLVVLETDPNQFNQNGIFKISNLTYSFDLPYVLGNAGTFGKENVSFFIGRRLFAVGTYKPYLDQMWRNYKNPTFASFESMNQTTYDYIMANQGHGLSPIDNYIEKDFNVLDSTSHRTLDWLFSYYQFSEMQLSFYQKILSRAKEQNIPLLVVWPSSSPSFEALLEKSPAIQQWRKRLDTVNQLYGVKLFVLRENPNYHCNGFADGGHIASECYHSLARVLLTKELHTTR